MINLQLHLSNDPVEAEKRLNYLMNKHWIFLNPTTKTKPYRLKKYALMTKCVTAINKLQTTEFLNELDLDPNQAKMAVNFFEKIILNDAKLLKKIILSAPKDLETLCITLEILLPSDMLYITEGKVVKQTKFGRYLSEYIFNYDAFRSSDHCLELYKEGMNGDLHACPYCNLKEITITKMSDSDSTEKRRKAYLDIDHFFPKVRYPYYAVSFFNLVPSCHDCNSSEKGAKDFLLGTHVHPYVDCFDDIYDFSLNSTQLASGIFCVDLNFRSGASRSDRTASDLNLTERYNANLAKVQAIYEWYRKYSTLFNRDREMHIEFFKSHFPDKKCDILKKPRSKLLRDIFRQIDAKNLLTLT